MKNNSHQQKGVPPWNQHPASLAVTARISACSAFVLSPEMANQSPAAARQAKRDIYLGNWPVINKVFSYRRGVKPVRLAAPYITFVAFMLAAVFGLGMLRYGWQSMPQFLPTAAVFLASLTVWLLIKKPPDPQPQEHLVQKVELEDEPFMLFLDLRATARHANIEPLVNNHYRIQELLALSQIAHTAKDDKKADQYLNLARTALGEHHAEISRIQAEAANQETGQAAALLSRLEQQVEPDMVLCPPTLSPPTY